MRFMMKRKRIFAALMAGIIMVGSICSSTAQAAAKWPKGPDKGSLSSASAIVMELSTGTVLYSKNIHKKHYPASITKIMTSLLTLENSSPSDVVTFTEAEATALRPAAPLCTVCRGRSSRSSRCFMASCSSLPMKCVW
ncbi:hypothetical protein DXC08_01310 [Clostridium sp. OM07-9AC]|nr:hypothetical protein DXC08_01310 [Clostridium sp. OM07-9AC]